MHNPAGVWRDRCDANHLPIVRGTDNAIWNRLHAIPFDTAIPKSEQDKSLPDKLAAESEGILAWGAAGARRWYAEGLGKSRPPDIERASAAWRARSDQVARFTDAAWVVDGDARAGAQALYIAYREWAKQSNETAVMGQQVFAGRIEALYPKRHIEEGSFYFGIRLTGFFNGHC